MLTCGRLTARQARQTICAGCSTMSKHAIPGCSVPHLVGQLLLALAPQLVRLDAGCRHDINGVTAVFSGSTVTSHPALTHRPRASSMARQRGGGPLALTHGARPSSHPRHAFEKGSSKRALAKTAACAKPGFGVCRKHRKLTAKQHAVDHCVLRPLAKTYIDSLHCRCIRRSC